MNLEEEYRAPKTHSQLRAMVDSFCKGTQTSRQEARLDRDYYDGEQISALVLKELQKRGQPPLYINKIANVVNGMWGVMDAAASDPEAFPRSAKSQDAADLATKTIRYLVDRANFKRLKRGASETFVIEGIAAAMVEYDGRHVNLARIRFEEFVFDPVSREHDFSDALFLGQAKLMDASEAATLYPEFDAAQTFSDDFFDLGDDEARLKWWIDNDRKLVRIVDLYYKVGHDWHRAVFTSAQVLYVGPSDYRDDEGESICPVLATSYEVAREGLRYGAVRHMRPLQDDINSRRSKLLHHLVHRQVKATDMNATATRAEAIREAAKADGAIPFGWDAVGTPDLAQGQMLIYSQSVEDLNRMGPTPAVLGRVSGANESGRARQILQQAGYTELARAYGRFEAFEAAIYRTVWFAAKQFLTSPMWIRIASDPRAIEFLQVNEPVMGLVPQPVVDPATGEPMLDAYGQPVVQPVLGQVGTMNRLAELDMDIVLSTVPDTVTLQQESFQSILEMAASVKMDLLDPRFQLLVEMSPMPNKRDIVEKIEAFRQQMAAQQQPDPMAEQATILDFEAQKAEIEKDRAKAFRDITSAQAQSVEMVRRDFGFD